MWRPTMYENRQTVCVVTSPNGVGAAPSNSAMIVCFVVCFAWLFMRVWSGIC